MCGTICRAYYTAQELTNLDFSSNAMKRQKGRKHLTEWTFLPDVSKCWQGTETPAVCTAHHFHFLLNEMRCEVWLLWHRNCQPLTQQRVRSEHSPCCLPQGTQELVWVFEIWGLAIIKKQVTHIAGKLWSPHWADFSETLRKSLILVLSCKNRREILESLHWWGRVLFSAVRLHCLQQSEMGLRRWCQASAFFLLLCSFVVF